MLTFQDYETIRNVIARYCFILDDKKYNELREIFWFSPVISYPIRDKDYTDVRELATDIEKRLQHVTTQHAITTQQILPQEGTIWRATATSYYTAAHFGTGKWEGKLVTVWGTYKDLLYQVPGDAGKPSGQWRIAHRTLTFTKRIGEEGVLNG